MDNMVKPARKAALWKQALMNHRGFDGDQSSFWNVRKKQNCSVLDKIRSSQVVFPNGLLTKNQYRNEEVRLK